MSVLTEIASLLNREVALGRALRLCLARTVELLDLNAGWIWLVESDQTSVYLATAYALPPALADHPERLAGWCWCIDKYRSGELAESGNVSEIRCSRLEKLAEVPGGLRYHATVPLLAGDRQLGLMNLLHDDQRKLSAAELEQLNAIGELLSVAIFRTEQYEQSFAAGKQAARKLWADRLQRIWRPELAAIQSRLAAIASESPGQSAALEELSSQIAALEEHWEGIGQELQESMTPVAGQPAYPNTPLTERELEVLRLVDRGLINRDIGTELFISERTVKFHVSTILQKLGATTRTEAVRIARQRRWLE